MVSDTKTVKLVAGGAVLSALTTWASVCGPAAFVSLTTPGSAESSSPTPTLRGAVDDSVIPRASRTTSSLGHGALVAALAGLGVAVASRARRNADGRNPNVTMKYLRRGENYLRPNAKGTKPLINRSIAADDIKLAHEGWKKKYRSAGEMEDIMKKTIYGRIQFQFASQHFTDELPWIPFGGKSNAGRREQEVNHHYDDAIYVRKYIKPAKFKKLELASWELPEHAPKVASLDELVRAGVQYGHTASSWHPKMLPYLYSDFDGTHIFDLVQTAAQLNRSCYYVMEAAAKGAKFLFTGTKEQASPFIKAIAQATGSFYCDERFPGGLLTNFNKVREAIELMKKMKREQEQGAWQTLGEDTVVRNKMKANRLYRKYKGVAEMDDLPDIMIVVDEVKERNAVMEAARIGIPVIGLLDSNNIPDNIDLPIPGNASGTRSIELVLNKLGDAIQKGQAIYNNTPVSDRPEFPKEFDPWLFSKDRIRVYRRKTKRQPWHKTMYGSYENFKKANPYGYIPNCGEYEDVQWNMKISEGMYGL